MDQQGSVGILIKLDQFQMKYKSGETTKKIAMLKSIFKAMTSDEYSSGLPHSIVSNNI